MARCLIAVLLSALVIVGQSLSSSVGDISDGSSSDQIVATVAKTAQPDATGKMLGVASKPMDADIGKKDDKSEPASAAEKSSAKPSERDAARTHFNNLGFLESIKNKLPSLLTAQPFGYQPYVQQAAPIISTAPFHSVKPIAFPQSPVGHVAQPIVTAGHIPSPVYEQPFASKPSYSILQQVIHKPLITELQEVVRKPVFAELQEVIHKPILTEVQQVIKRPLYTEHIIKHPSFNSLHQEVVEQPLHLQAQQYHLVAKPLSQIVQLPTQHLVQQPFVQQPFVQQPFVQQPFVQQPFVQQPFVQQPFVQQPFVQQPFAQPVIGGQVVSSPTAAQYGNGLSPYGFLSPSPLSFPWGFTKPPSGFSGSPFNGFVGSSLSSVSSPVVSSVPSPVISSVPSSVISSVPSPVISSVPSSVISSVPSPVVSSVSSSPVVSEFAYPPYTFSSPLNGHSSGEFQFLTSSTCRSGSCGPRAADSGEIPMNFGEAEFADNMPNGILYNSAAAMPQANFVQANENLAMPYFTQSQPMYVQPMLSTTGNGDKGGNDNALDASMNTKSSVGNAKSASSDRDDYSAGDKKILVLTDLASLSSNSNSQKQYQPISLQQFYRMANDMMKERNDALEFENNRVETALQRLRNNPEAMKAIDEIIDKAMN